MKPIFEYNKNMFKSYKIKNLYNPAWSFHITKILSLKQNVLKAKFINNCNWNLYRNISGVQHLRLNWFKKLSTSYYSTGTRVWQFHCSLRNSTLWIDGQSVHQWAYLWWSGITFGGPKKYAITKKLSKSWFHQVMLHKMQQKLSSY